MCDKINWKELMLNFMKCIGEGSGEWHPELWESYGITKEQAKKIINEYEKKFKNE